MITEEEVRKASHFRFGGVSGDHSAFRGVFIHGAMWAIVEMQAESARLRAENEKILSDVKRAYDLIEGDCQIPAIVEARNILREILKK